MADELTKKKPDLGSGSSSMSAPKAAPTPKPQAQPSQNSTPKRGFNAPNKLKSGFSKVDLSKHDPKITAKYNEHKKVWGGPVAKQTNVSTGTNFNIKPQIKDNFNKQQNIKKQAGVTPTTLPKAKDSMELGVPDSVRQKIMNAGFAPKNYNIDSEKGKKAKDLMNQIKENNRQMDLMTSQIPYNGLTPESKKKYDFLRQQTDSLNEEFENSGFSEEDLDYIFNDEEDVLDNETAEKIQNSEDDKNNLDPTGQFSDKEVNDMFDKPLEEEPAPQQQVWDKNNEPGSGAVTKELEDFTRDYLTKSGGLSDEFIEKTIQSLRGDSRKADFYKQKMKEAYEREQASKLFGTDLNKKEEYDPETGEKYVSSDMPLHISEAFEYPVNNFSELKGNETDNHKIFDNIVKSMIQKYGRSYKDGNGYDFTNVWRDAARQAMEKNGIDTSKDPYYQDKGWDY